MSLSATLEQGDVVMITEVSTDHFAYSVGVRSGYVGIILSPCCVCSSGYHKDAALVLSDVKNEEGMQYAFCCSLNILEKITVH